MSVHLLRRLSIAGLTAAVLAAIVPGVAFADPAPPDITSADYAECTPTDCVAHGSPETPGTFTFHGDAETVAFRYGWNGQGITPVEATDGVASVTLVPPSYGRAQLSVRAVAANGLSSADTTYAFEVAHPSPSRARWPLEARILYPDPFGDERRTFPLTPSGDAALTSDIRSSD